MKAAWATTLTREGPHSMPDDPPRPVPPATDKAARMNGALLGSPWALAEDRRRAAAAEEAFPGTAALFKAAARFAGRFATWATAGRRCGGVLFAASGLPGPSPRWHAEAAALAPGARFLYADASKVITDLRAMALRDDERAAAVQGSVLDPEGLLRSPEALRAAQGGNLAVVLNLVIHNISWEGGATLLADCARLLPAGSPVALTGLLIGAGPAGRELRRLLEDAGWPVHSHSAQDIEGWMTAAGMTLHDKGAADVREFRSGRWRPARRDRPEARMVQVTGFVPKRAEEARRRA